jgi:hypothetical protein
MATPREIFEKDSKNLRVHAEHEVKDSRTGETAEVIATVAFDFEAGVTYGSLFIGDTPLAVAAIAHYLDHQEDLLKVGQGVETISSFLGTDERISSADLHFSGRILAYTAYKIPPEAKRQLFEKAAARRIGLVIRDGQYLSQRIAMESPMAFISHDSRDKEPFVRDLASKLQTMLCTVWYDEFSLVPGQSLRATIEKGLKTCKKCVLILSPHFIGNDGWTKAEFDSIFTREILEKKNVVIPVWHGVTKEQVYEYSPRLLDRVAIPSSIGVEEVARKLLQGINHEEPA